METTAHAAPTDPRAFTSFEQFYPFYLTEPTHANP